MCMNLENIILREINLTEKDKYDFTHMWNLDRQTKQNKQKQNRNKLRYREKNANYWRENEKGQGSQMYRGGWQLDL